MASAATAAALPRKLRVLCLHGFYQSATIFRMKTAAMRKSLASVAEFEYLEAPLPISDADEFKMKPADGVTPDTYFAWWKFNQPAQQRYTGWSQSIAHLRAHIQAQGPFDAYMGFSQGAAFLALVAALASAQRADPAKVDQIAARFGEQVAVDYSWFLAPSAAAAASAGAGSGADSSTLPPLSPPLLILVSGFVPRVPHLKQFFPQPLAPSDGAVPPTASHSAPFAFDADIPLIACPSLHVIGLGDKDVPPSESDDLRRSFLGAQVETHEGGHLVPNNAHFCRRYKQFMLEHAARR